MLGPPNQMVAEIGPTGGSYSISLDWLEVSCLLSDSELSRPSVVSYLVEEQFVDSQHAAWDAVYTAWDLSARRLDWLTEFSPIRVSGDWMSRTREWHQVPAYTYCLLVSFGPAYEEWHTALPQDFTLQGDLFEEISEAAVAGLFPSWDVIRTQWRGKNALKIDGALEHFVATIGEKEGNPDDYLSDDANDAGLDLAWHLPLGDARSGRPIYLAQCASGKNWVNKVKEPDLSLWTKIVDFASMPSKAFFLPFHLSDSDLRYQTARADGWIADRYRILCQQVDESGWVPSSLRAELVEWLEPRVQWLLSSYGSEGPSHL